MLYSIVAGAAAGAICKPVCSKLAAILLKNRGKNCEESKLESILLVVLSALAGAAIALLVPFSAETVYLFLVLICCEIVAITDIGQRIIPNEMVFAIIGLALLFGIPSLLGVKGFPEFNILHSLLGMVGCFIIFMLPSLFSKKVGAGDVKLAAAMGFCLGLWNSLFGIVIMGVLVLIYTFVQNRIPSVTFIKSMIPMGPFLAGAMVIILLLIKLPLFSGLTGAMPF